MGGGGKHITCFMVEERLKIVEKCRKDKLIGNRIEKLNQGSCYFGADLNMATRMKIGHSEQTQNQSQMHSNGE